MPQTGPGAELVKHAAGPFEPRALHLEQWVAGLVGGSKMRVHGVEREIGAGQERRQRPLQVVVAEAEPVHAGINLEVIAQGRFSLLGCGLQGVARRRT